MEEKLVDVLGFEGYYKISETGKLYKVRPNLECGFDIIKECNLISCNKDTKKHQILVSLSRNGLSKSIHWKTIFHDSFFPSRVGMKYKFKNDIVSLNTIELFDTFRQGAKNNTEERVKSSLEKNPKLTSDEIGRFCGVSAERVRQIKRKLKK